MLSAASRASLGGVTPASPPTTYLDDELPAEGRHAVEEHLADCPTCPPLYASVVSLQETLGEMRDTDKVVPDEIAARIAAALAGCSTEG